MTGALSRAVTAATAGVVLASTIHAAPAAFASTRLRRRCCPRLSGVGAASHVALTFDDGPDPRSTPAFLDALGDADVKATFFVLGEMLVANPGLGRRLVEAGHEVALHGWGHRCLLARGPRSTYDDLARGHDAVTRVCGVTPRWYRPPYGVLTTSALVAVQRLDLAPVLWTTWGRDWTARSSPARVVTEVGRRLGPGGTVLLHDSDCTSAPDSWRASVAALPALIADIEDRGLVPGPLRDHWERSAGPRPRPGRSPRDADR